MKNLMKYSPIFCTLLVLSSCSQPTETVKEAKVADITPKYLAEPLIVDHYTADPSAHVFDRKIYIYPFP